MTKYLIKGGQVVNEGKIERLDIFIVDERIEKIDKNIEVLERVIEIDASDKYIFPGIIDDQVHFRQPGLTHKADIFTESRAAVAGGVTSFMEMPNVVPQTTTQQLLEEKYQMGKAFSLANYSFYIGVTNSNLEEVLKTNPKEVCGAKIFMGSSTGDMLVDNQNSLEKIFREIPFLIATHCEDEDTIKKNLEIYKSIYGDSIPIKCHPEIRSIEACLLSSSRAIHLAKKYDTRLHILHISTAKEAKDLFTNKIALGKKRITSEVCPHHLWFTAEDYGEKGAFIKWNPAIKYSEDRDALWDALLDDRLDVIATDHAPHTLEEKKRNYLQAPSGGPLIQHALVAMLDFYHQKKISLEKIIEKMCHAPAQCFTISGRGYLREGYYADVVLVNLNDPWQVEQSNIKYKCSWSPFEGHVFRSKITHTFVSGHLAYNEEKINEGKSGLRLRFNH